MALESGIFINWFFVTISGIFITLFLVICYKYVMFKEYFKNLEQIRGKRVICRDFAGNSVDLGKFVKYTFQKGVPVIQVETEERETDYYGLSVFENKITNAIIDYSKELMILTDFEKSDLNKHVIVSLLSKEIIKHGLVYGIKRVKEVIEPILEELEEYQNQINLLLDELRITKKNSVIRTRMDLIKVEKAFAPVLDQFRNSLYTANLWIKKRIAEAHQESDEVSPEELEEYEKMIEEMPSKKVELTNFTIEDEKGDVKNGKERIKEKEEKIITDTVKDRKKSKPRTNRT